MVELYANGTEKCLTFKQIFGWRKKKTENLGQCFTYLVGTLIFFSFGENILGNFGHLTDGCSHKQIHCLTIVNAHIFITAPGLYVSNIVISSGSTNSSYLRTEKGNWNSKFQKFARVFQIHFDLLIKSCEMISGIVWGIISDDVDGTISHHLP